jgi:hypothetical protein
MKESNPSGQGRDSRGLRGLFLLSVWGRDLLHVAVLVDSLTSFVRNGSGFSKANGFAADVAEYAEHPFTVPPNTN